MVPGKPFEIEILVLLGEVFADRLMCSDESEGGGDGDCDDWDDDVDAEDVADEDREICVALPLLDLPPLGEKSPPLVPLVT